MKTLSDHILMHYNHALVVFDDKGLLLTKNAKSDSIIENLSSSDNTTYSYSTFKQLGFQFEQIVCEQGTYKLGIKEYGTTNLSAGNIALQLLNHAVDAVILTDIDSENGFRIVWVNEAFEKLTGYGLTEVLGKSPKILQGPETDPNVLKRLKRELKEHNSFHGSAINYKKSGEQFFNEWKISPILNEDKEVINYVSFIRDISSYESVNQVIKYLSDESEKVYESITEGIVVQNLQGHIVAHNKAAESILGLTHAQIIGRDSYDDRWRAFDENMDDLPGDKHAITRSRIIGECVNGEVMGIHTPSGEKKWLRVTSRPILKPNGQIGGAMCTFQDFTAEKKYQLQLHKSVQEKDVLLKEIHHRVKNNLQMVSSLLYLQAGRSSDHDVHKILTETQNRILAISHTHEKLLNSDDYKKLDIKSYLNKFIYDITSSIDDNETKIDLDIHIESVSLPTDVAMYLGLFTNEVLMSFYKYGFAGKAHGDINIDLVKVNDHIHYSLSCKDCVHVDSKEDRSIGFQLIQLFVKQLTGVLEIKGDNGNSYVLTIPYREL